MVPGWKRAGQASLRPPPSSATTSSPSLPILGRASFRGRGRFRPSPAAMANSLNTFSSQSGYHMRLRPAPCCKAQPQDRAAPQNLLAED